jgi:ABC-type transporter Mla subunit MlaD
MQNLQQILASFPEQVRSVESERRDGDAERQNTMRQITGDLAETIRRAVEQLSGHAEVAESLRAAAGQMAESTRSLESFSGQIREASGMQEKAASAAENAAVSNARVAGALGSLPDQMATASGGLTKAAEAIRQTTRSATQGYTQVAEQQHRFVQELADGLGQFAARIREVLQVYGEDVQTQTRDRIREFAEGTTGILNQLANLESELKGDLETVETLAIQIREDALR